MEIPPNATVPMVVALLKQAQRFDVFGTNIYKTRKKYYLKAKYIGPYKGKSFKPQGIYKLEVRSVLPGYFILVRQQAKRYAMYSEMYPTIEKFMRFWQITEICEEK